MAYWGQDGDYNKFRCPHAAGKVNCCHGVRWCFDSDYGLVVKSNPADDYRTYTLPHRRSRTWEKLYNKRTSVERVLFYHKETFNLTKIMVWSRKKAQTHIELNLIAFLATKIAAAEKVLKKKTSPDQLRYPAVKVLKGLLSTQDNMSNFSANILNFGE